MRLRLVGSVAISATPMGIPGLLLLNGPGGRSPFLGIPVEAVFAAFGLLPAAVLHLVLSRQIRTRLGGWFTVMMAAALLFPAAVAGGKFLLWAAGMTFPLLVWLQTPRSEAADAVASLVIAALAGPLAVVPVMLIGGVAYMWLLATGLEAVAMPVPVLASGLVPGVFLLAGLALWRPHEYRCTERIYHR